MQRNLISVLMVSFLTSFAWSAHLMRPQTCFPCIFAANHLLSRTDKSLDTLLAIASSSDIPSSVATSYLLNWESLSPVERAKEVAAIATARQLVRCRHARSAELRDAGAGVKAKRRGLSPDLNLCHFKICNMGRKRTQRFIHTVNALRAREE